MSITRRATMALAAATTSLMLLANTAMAEKDYRSKIWPDRYFVPGRMRGYCKFSAPSSGCGFGAMVTGAGGR